jgi:hypothetical protein
MTEWVQGAFRSGTRSVIFPPTRKCDGNELEQFLPIWTQWAGCRKARLWPMRRKLPTVDLGGIFHKIE